LIARGQHDDRNRFLFIGPQPAQHAQAIHSRQVPIEHDGVVLPRRSQVQSRDAIGRRIQRMPARLEIVVDIGGQLGVVFDDEDRQRERVHESPAAADPLSEQRDFQETQHG
jgi:hypothetical protein